ncbi:MAG: glycine--tRNA ligase subunit beta [Pseudomonadota bacterium]
MSELLLEFFSEEIPARMQARAEADLERLMRAQLDAAGLSFERFETFSGPRRLGLVIDGLPEKTEDVREERKGPKVGAPDKAIEGFLRSAGLTSLDQCKIEAGKKGEFYIALIEKPGRNTAEVIAEAVPEIAKGFPWPKSMKFGEGDKTQRWVRPLQRVICLLGGAVVPLEVFGIAASDETEGHRVHGRGPFTVKDFADYESTLRRNGVILGRAERREAVLVGARQVCAEAGLELVEDAGLLDEVAGLVEHPVPVLGEMDPDFLDLPPEVITLTMKVHQRYFAVRDPKTGQLAPKFVMLANQDAPDGGKAIALGAARVLSARLSDARHFWDADLKTGLDAMAGELSKVTFHEKLGTVADKVERVAALARELADAVGADPDLAERAARLAKADLVSQMVYEFPELQGAMGRYYALKGGEDPAIADAIRDHYKPQGPSDDVPTAPVSAAVALADKLDTLVGFWAIDEKPTGSKDPFALRRAALGVIRTILDTETRIELEDPILFVDLMREFRGGLRLTDSRSPMKERIGEVARQLKRDLARKPSGEILLKESARLADLPFADDEKLKDLFYFFLDRIYHKYRDIGFRHDVFNAAGDVGIEDDLVLFVRRVTELQAFIDTDDGAALLAGYRRAANILKAEEKKDGAAYDGAPEADYLAEAPEPEERALIAALQSAGGDAQAALEREDFEAAMSALASLRGPVDAFFEAVTVNAEEEVLRRNRLLLLSKIRSAVHTVADFDRLEG